MATWPYSPRMHHCECVAPRPHPWTPWTPPPATSIALQQRLQTPILLAKKKQAGFRICWYSKSYIKINLKSHFQWIIHQKDWTRKCIQCLWLTSIQMGIKSNGNCRTMPWQNVERENICWKLVIVPIMSLTENVSLFIFKRLASVKFQQLSVHFHCTANALRKNTPGPPGPKKIYLPFELNCRSIKMQAIKISNLYANWSISKAYWLSMIGLIGTHAMKMIKSAPRIVHRVEVYQFTAAIRFCPSF